MKRNLVLCALLLSAVYAGSMFMGRVSAQKGVMAPVKSPVSARPENSTPQTLPFSQDWSNVGLITANDDWTGVPGIQGFQGNDLTTGVGVDARTILADGSATTLDVIANQTNCDTNISGGVAECEAAGGNPTIALQGSGTADVPYVIFYLNTTGQNNIRVQYNARDIDGSADNAVQQINTQYRVGSTGNFINLPGGYIADASNGPSSATLVTPVAVTLPSAANNQPLVEVRVTSTNAVGSDEWIGIDDINITAVAEPTTARAKVDYNGDLRTDYSVLRNVGGNFRWFNQLNGGSASAVDWGINTDRWIPEDYDGDGKTDIAVWRAGPQGVFYILRSSDLAVNVVNFGTSGDDPTVTDDYTGDGKADPAVYRAGAQSSWWYLASSGPRFGTQVVTQWGQSGDFPAPGDYNGDGMNDFMVQRNAGGGLAAFWFHPGTGGTDAPGADTYTEFGTPTDVIVPGDYDGDGKTDIAVVRGISGALNWFYRRSSGGPDVNIIWGASATDARVQGDYDGDGRTDIAVWRPADGSFLVLNSAGGTIGIPWGTSGDIATATYNNH